MILKHCSGCSTEKPADDFAWKNKAQGRRQSRCRSCQSTALAAWYQKNSDSHKASVAKYNARLRTEKRELVRKLKESASCADCNGKFHFAAMDFDHLSDKKFNVSALVYNGQPLAALLSEIDKCELVCANCHRVRTWERSQAQI